MPVQKLTQSESKTIMRAKQCKFLEENIGINFLDLGLGNCFLDLTPKAQVTKEKNG